jgi:selenocysteine lyase/cysteine desulfurase
VTGLSIAEAARLFSPQPAYLNTASYGLPPRPAFEAFAAVADEWRHGRTEWMVWNEQVDVARELFARLVNVAPADVSVGTQVSAFVGIVAASLSRGDRVVCAEEDFTSVLFPLLAMEPRGVVVDLVPLESLADAVTDDVSLVAVSAVQSADGRVADLDAISAAAAAAGALTLVDATQACGWLPVDASRFDYVVCATYKWLLGPRGCALMTVRPSAAERLTPILAGWFAAESKRASYGGPLRLADGARRFDVSPAWFSWVGLVPALELFLDVGVDTIHAHDVGLANRFRGGLGLEPGDSAIVSISAAAGAADRLRAAGVAFADHGELLRFSFHLYTSADDVDRALSALAG